VLPPTTATAYGTLVSIAPDLCRLALPLPPLLVTATATAYHLHNTCSNKLTNDNE